MATFNKVNAFVEDLAEKVHNLGSDTLKVALFASDPTASATTYTALASGSGELGNANGYTTGGTAATISSSAQSSGTYKLVLADVTFTASGGDLGGTGDVFRYVVLYNDSAASKQVIGYYDYGSNLTIADGNSFTVDFDASNGVLTIA